MAMKPADRWCISLCAPHHKEQHMNGEALFSEYHKINMKALADEFARKSPHWPKLRDMP